MLGALLEACARTPHAPAMSLGEVTLSFGQLRERVLAVAASLTAEGMRPGDRVLFSVRPGLDGFSLALGVIAAGGTIVFADPGAGESMFRARAALAAPKWVAAESLLYAASTPLLRPLARKRGLELPDYRTLIPDARYIVAGPRLPGVPRGALRLRSLLADRAAGGSAEHSFEVAPDDTAEALIIFTSGTTAAPKAVVHSRRSLGTGLDDFARRVGFIPGQSVLTDQLMIGIPALISGAHWMLPPVGLDPGASPAQYLPLVPRADLAFFVPAALDAVLTLLDAETSPLRTAPHTILVGGAPVLRPLLERALARFPGVRIVAIYGMTEVLPIAMAEGADKLAFDGTGDYVGEIMTHIEARIVDGQLEISGPGLALGYLSDLPDKPLTSVRTGDVARLEGSRLILAGRSKDMFIRGITNVYPGLYEPVIAGLPQVRDVAMVGVPNRMGDDRLVLVVVPDAPAGAAVAGEIASGSRLAYEHSAIAQVSRALPGLIDAAVLPDLILAAHTLPKSGRSNKLNRAALTTEVAEFVTARGLLP